LQATIFLNLQKHAKANGNQYNVPALIAHFKDNYLRSRNNNPYFYFLPQQAGEYRISPYRSSLLIFAV
jgi:hypothetical protein